MRRTTTLEARRKQIVFYEQPLMSDVLEYSPITSKKNFKQNVLIGITQIMGSIEDCLIDKLIVRSLQLMSNSSHLIYEIVVSLINVNGLW